MNESFLYRLLFFLQRNQKNKTVILTVFYLFEEKTVF